MAAKETSLLSPKKDATGGMKWTTSLAEISTKIKIAWTHVSNYRPITHVWKGEGLTELQNWIIIITWGTKSSLRMPTGWVSALSPYIKPASLSPLLVYNIPFYQKTTKPKRNLGNIMFVPFSSKTVRMSTWNSGLWKWRLRHMRNVHFASDM